MKIRCELQHRDGECRSTLATCFCNDIYREADGSGIEVLGIDVAVESTFGGVGDPAEAIGYRVAISARGSEAAIRQLVEHTDTVTEIQNTIRQGMPVELTAIDVEVLA